MQYVCSGLRRQSETEREREREERVCVYYASKSESIGGVAAGRPSSVAARACVPDACRRRRITTSRLIRIANAPELAGRRSPSSRLRPSVPLFMSVCLSVCDLAWVSAAGRRTCCGCTPCHQSRSMPWTALVSRHGQTACLRPRLHRHARRLIANR